MDEARTYFSGMHSHIDRQNSVINYLTEQLQRQSAMAIQASQSEQQLVQQLSQAMTEVRSDAIQRHNSIMERAEEEFRSLQDECSTRAGSYSEHLRALREELLANQDYQSRLPFQCRRNTRSPIRQGTRDHLTRVYHERERTILPALGNHRENGKRLRKSPR